jgi:predicted ABC-type ATPase
VVRPFIFVLAGVNGAGKSSVGGAMLAGQGLPWFNPDSYARELSRQLELPLEEANGRAWVHGKTMLEAAIANRTNHAFETTLGGATITRLLAEASRTHAVVMMFCGLTSPELHIERVAQRVACGGHPIAEQKIRERWVSSRLNLIQLLPVLARLQVFDNSASAKPGEEIADPVLVLDMKNSQVIFPQRLDPASLAAVPPWARPIVEACIQMQ